MNTGHYSGYTGDTLVHLDNGTRKYMCDLAPGDELKLRDFNFWKRAVVSRIIKFEFDGFISLVAPGLRTTRYTIYHDYNTGEDTTPEEQNKPTLYYRGLLYNFFITEYDVPCINMGTDPTASQIGIYDIDNRVRDDITFTWALSGEDSGVVLIPVILADPPGLVTQRHPKIATV